MIDSYKQRTVLHGIGILNAIEDLLDERDVDIKKVKGKLIDKLDFKEIKNCEDIETSRTVERIIKVVTGYEPVEYIEIRYISKIINNEIKSIYEKEKLNDLAKKHFKATINEIKDNRQMYYLQEKPTVNDIYHRYMRGLKDIPYRVLTGETLYEDKGEVVETRYMGRTVFVPMKDGDKYNVYSFTKDMNSKLADCKVDYKVSLRESELQEKIDYMYEKYKDKPIELDESIVKHLNHRDMEILNTKINSFMHGDRITLKVCNNDIIDILDFYPKAKLIQKREIHNSIDILIDSIHQRKKRKIDLDNIIVISGLEILESILRAINCTPDTSIICIGKKYNILILSKLHRLISYLADIYYSYSNKIISKTHAINEINEIMDEIVFYEELLQELKKLI